MKLLFCPSYISDELRFCPKTITFLSENDKNSYVFVREKLLFCPRKVTILSEKVNIIYCVINSYAAYISYIYSIIKNKIRSGIIQIND